MESTRQMSMYRIANWTLCAGLLAASLSVAEDWPTWLGPGGDSTWRTKSLPADWSTGSLGPRWKVAIGGGYAGIAVANGRLYTMDRPGGSNTVRKPDGVERVVCLNAKNGRQLWQYEYPANYQDLDYPNGPRAMPTLAGDRVYTLGAVGQLCCLDASTGKEIWSKQLVNEYKARVPTWGFAGAPLVHETQVIVHVGAEAGGCLLSFDRRTGAELWRSLDDPAGYGAPQLAATRTGPQLILWTPEHVHGVDPGDGKPLWKHAHKVTYGVAIAAPLVRDNMVFVSGYWEGSRALALGPRPTDAKLVWEDARQLRGLMSAPVYRDGHVYLLDKQLGITCFELKTGKKRWDDNHRTTPRGRNPQVSICWLGDTDRALILNSKGELIHAELNPRGLREISRHPIVGPTWCYPAFADGAIFARSDENNELVCVPMSQ